MPEMTFTVEWPDGSFQECYSPSLVMHDHITTGESYPVPEFVRRVASALDEASGRVREKYGFACTSAAAQKEEIQGRAQQFSPDPSMASAGAEAAGRVRVLSMEPPLQNTTNHQEVSS
jgi:uncharacterized repeat protein (TIGR04042 family)